MGIANDRFLVVRYALGLIAVRPLYTYTFSLHLQNTHATDARILVYSFPPAAERTRQLPSAR